MKKLFESDFNGYNESVSKITVYLFDNDTDEEFWEFYNMSHDELCEFFDVFDENGYDIPLGVTYYTYDFQFTKNYLTMTETLTLNT